MTMFGSDSFTRPEDWEYGDIAENIVKGAGYSRISEYSHNIETTSSHAPIYPFFLSVFYRMGNTPIVYIIIILIQIIISLFTVFIFYQISIVLFNKHTGFLTAVVLAIYPPIVYYSTKLTPTTFFVFFIGLTIFSLLKIKNANYRTALIAGAILGMTILTNPIAFAFIPAIIIWFLWKKRADSKTLIFVILSAMILLVPWTVRNFSVHQRIVPVTTQFGKNFWIGNNKRATGTDYYRVTKNKSENMVLITNTLPRSEKNHLAVIPEIERSDYFIEEGTRFIKQNPGEFTALLLKKFYYFWWFTPPEINGSFDALRFRGIYIIFYLPLLIFGIVGIVIALSKKYFTRSILPVLIIFTIAAIYIFTHVGLARYRVPVEVLLIIFATHPPIVLFKKLTGKNI